MNQSKNITVRNVPPIVLFLSFWLHQQIQLVPLLWNIVSLLCLLYVMKPLSADKAVIKQMKERASCVV